VTDTATRRIRQYRFTPPPGASTVLLVRHGESWPADPGEPFPLVGGHGAPGLAPEGEEQARRLGERLAGERVDAIYVTSLCRTAQTAAPLAERLGIEPIVVPELREVFLGEWEGGQFRVKAEAGDPVFRRIFEEERWDVIPGAEPLDEFDARVRAGLARVVSEHPDGRVVVVSHGGVIGHILHIVAESRRFAFSTVDNGSISEIVIGPDHTILRRYNATSHLA
jgi:probable phosphoglycerate mutase